VLAALEVLKRRRTEHHVLYVGHRTEHSDEFLRSRLGGSIARDWVLWNPNADETNMARILASSSAMVHLTEGEETAVTPLEGLASGLPVIASRAPAFEESLGGAARLMSPEEEEDPEALADAILEAIEGGGDPAERDRVVQAHTWAANASATVEVYRKLTS
jgi:glycosyltransferase involved in cell wall biosynthesis